MALQQKQQSIDLSEAEYLASEMDSPVKHEFIDGQIYPMAGADYNHNGISANILGEFRNHLKGTPCATFMADINEFRQAQLSLP